MSGLLSVNDVIRDSIKTERIIPGSERSNVVQQIAMKESIGILVEFSIGDHGVMPYDLLVTSGLNLSNTWIGLSADPRTSAYGKHLIILCSTFTYLIVTA